jgi:hypothetical protein
LPSLPASSGCGGSDVKRVRNVSIAAAAVVFVAACALSRPASAQAVGGRYAFDGGTPREQRQVTRALEVSDFHWDAVPGRVVIHIERGTDSHATPGHIWLDADLLEAGSFAWGVVQHEYAHQVDFVLFDDADRATLLSKLGGRSWCTNDARFTHEELGCERFASTLAWAYWPSPENCMRPEGPADESAALPAAEFRALVSELVRKHTRPAVRRLATTEARP